MFHGRLRYGCQILWKTTQTKIGKLILFWLHFQRFFNIYFSWLLRFNASVCCGSSLLPSSISLFLPFFFPSPPSITPSFLLSFSQSISLHFPLFQLFLSINLLPLLFSYSHHQSHSHLSLPSISFHLTIFLHFLPPVNLSIHFSFLCFPQAFSISLILSFSSVRQFYLHISASLCQSFFLSSNFSPFLFYSISSASFHSPVWSLPLLVSLSSSPFFRQSLLSSFLFSSLSQQPLLNPTGTHTSFFLLKHSSVDLDVSWPRIRAVPWRAMF